LDTNPLAGLVSPPLLGTSGVVPLSIVSVIPDIVRHYANLIVRAETEIILATNYWELSQSSGVIADSLRELSESVEARGGEKVVMKLMYDRGNLKQAVKHRILVDPAYWTRVGLPSEDEIPGISLEVVNYHHPLLGTFHAKYLVVDRRVACLNSNNVQDRPNVEMMVQLEGPIVESIYDMALLSWSVAMSPPLPLVSKPPKYPAVYKFQKNNEDLKCTPSLASMHIDSWFLRLHADIDPEAMSEATRAYLQGRCAVNEAQGVQPIATGPTQHCPGVDSVAADENRGDLIAEPLNMPVPSLHTSGNAVDYTSEPEKRRNEMIESHLNSLPNAEADFQGRNKPQGERGELLTVLAVVTSNADTTAGSEILARGEDQMQVTKSEEPNTSSTNPVGSGSTTMGAGKLPDTKASDSQGTPQGSGDGGTSSDFCPHILHKPHDPVPIAIVNRSPKGSESFPLLFTPEIVNAHVSLLFW
jgi:hypothetical protein